MAGPAFSCDLNTLIHESQCFLETCASDDIRDAVDLYVRIANLAAIGGTDYTSDLAQLLVDAKAWQVLAKNQRDTIELYIDIQNAIDNGAVIGPTPAAAQSVSCILCIGKEFRKAILSYLKCQINTLGRPD